ncbi:DUF421 domain-containing protein [Neogemmobacter tilapiae]|uniref:DUF421 domain-containing protein n=1 Tax=Neogemmobacter tilapiae TaxID=875041 RepID=A0A918WIQ4_9RHOB|nr:YetF domain-containing protein [Gemmobacter tilapiae]GHC55316.1 DUF421 domain-containing protein [Gemmobacter tilapiae]
MQDITAFDWPRLLWGTAPPLFLLEIAFRVLVIWLWTAALLRWIGGRSIAQLSIVEFLLVIALGSAVGDALFYPEVPLLHAMVVILLIVLLDKAVDLALRRWPKAKAVIDGLPVEVLRDGRILCDGLRARRLSTLELMELLRLKGIDNLGSLRRAYLEPSGDISIFRADPPRPGLCIMPPVERDPAKSGSGPVARRDEPSCCRNCGQLGMADQDQCGECGGQGWVKAVLPQA